MTKYYNNLNHKNLMDNRLFWKMVKLLFGENCFVSNNIVLVENENVWTTDQEVAETLNTLFSNVVRVSELQDNILINIDKDLL